MQTTPLDNPIADEGKFLFIQVLQLLNEERVIDFEYHRFATPHELVDLTTEFSMAVNITKEREAENIYLLMVKHDTSYEVLLPRKKKNSKRSTFWVQIPT